MNFENRSTNLVLTNSVNRIKWPNSFRQYEILTNIVLKYILSNINNVDLRVPAVCTNYQLYNYKFVDLKEMIISKVT